jgi:serine/threonine-protein kinase RsbW
MISVTECVNNAIVHGNKIDKKRVVKLELLFLDDQIKFIIEDEGDGFDHQKLNDPTALENLEKSGGRGVFIMKHLSDEVEFENEGKKITLTFYMN